MANQKYAYYVAVVENNKIRFVTNILPEWVAEWEDGKPALKMAMKMADEITMGLILNGFVAMTIKVPATISLSNSEKETQCDWKNIVSEKCKELLVDNEDNNRDNLTAGYDQGYYDGYSDGVHDGVVDVMNCLKIKHDEVYYND